MLRGRVLVFLTEQFPRSKDALGLVFPGVFHVPFFGVVSVTRMLGAQLLVTAIWPQPYSAVSAKKPQRERASSAL